MTSLGLTTTTTYNYNVLASVTANEIPLQTLPGLSHGPSSQAASSHAAAEQLTPCMSSTSPRELVAHTTCASDNAHRASLISLSLRRLPGGWR